MGVAAETYFNLYLIILNILSICSLLYSQAWNRSSSLRLTDDRGMLAGRYGSISCHLQIQWPVVPVGMCVMAAYVTVFPEKLEHLYGTNSKQVYDGK